MMDFQDSPLDQWKLEMARHEHVPSVLLCGTKVWPGSHNLDHRAHCRRAKWVTTDIEAGDEVDIVADLQTLWQTCEQRFDGVFCPAVLEHIERPWTALYSMSQVLKSGGALFIQTHQTFPLHGYPADFYRFSTGALESLCRDAGLEIVLSGYDAPCSITPAVPCVWNPLAKSFLNSSVCARKP